MQNLARLCVLLLPEGLVVEYFHDQLIEHKPVAIIGNPPNLVETSPYICCTTTARRSAHAYFEEEPGRRRQRRWLSRDEARRIAVNMAKLPDLLAKVLDHALGLSEIYSQADVGGGASLCIKLRSRTAAILAHASASYFNLFLSAGFDARAARSRHCLACCLYSATTR